MSDATPMRTDELLARLERHYIKPGASLPAARAHGSLMRAVDALTGGYEIQQFRRSLEQVEQAITNLRAVPGTQLELTS